MNQKIYKQIYNALVKAEYPTKEIVVKDVPCTFIFTENTPIVEDLSDLVTFVEQVVITKQNIKTLPTNLVSKIFQKYIEYHQEVSEHLATNLREYVKLPESRELWTVFKVTRPELVLTVRGQLNVVQQKWVVLNSLRDREERNELFMEVFKQLRPWLNFELYKAIEDKEKDGRENAFFDDDEYDRELQEKARKIAAEQKQNQKEVNKEDLDIVYIEKNKDK